MPRTFPEFRVSLYHRNCNVVQVPCIPAKELGKRVSTFCGRIRTQVLHLTAGQPPALHRCEPGPSGKSKRADNVRRMRATRGKILWSNAGRQTSLLCVQLEEPAFKYHRAVERHSYRRADGRTNERTMTDDDGRTRTFQDRRCNYRL